MRDRKKERLDEIKDAIDGFFCRLEVNGITKDETELEYIRHPLEDFVYWQVEEFRKSLIENIRAGVESVIDGEKYV